MNKELQKSEKYQAFIKIGFRQHAQNIANEACFEVLSIGMDCLPDTPLVMDFYDELIENISCLVEDCESKNFSERQFFDGLKKIKMEAREFIDENIHSFVMGEW